MSKLGKKLIKAAKERGDEREPGPIWGGWWFWEPPLGAKKETENE